MEGRAGRRDRERRREIITKGFTASMHNLG